MECSHLLLNLQDDHSDSDSNAMDSVFAFPLNPYVEVFIPMWWDLERGPVGGN